MMFCTNNLIKAKNYLANDNWANNKNILIQDYDLGKFAQNNLNYHPLAKNNPNYRLFFNNPNYSSNLLKTVPHPQLGDIVVASNLSRDNVSDYDESDEEGTHVANEHTN